MKLHQNLITIVALATVAYLPNCLSKNPNVRGLPNNDKLALIGDSIFALSGVEKKEIAKLAGENSRGYAQSGAQIAGIVDQYAKAKRAGTIRTMIMDGGGNDVLISAVLGSDECVADSPETLSDACLTTIHNTNSTAASLLATMAADGVADVLYQGYYYLPGSRANLNNALEVGMDLFRDMCEDAPGNCHWVDPREAFQGNEAAYVKSDDIHPTDPGSKVLAELVWATMVEFGIEQNQQ